MTVLLGIDEAGRGPVIGPLVLAGVALGSREMACLEALGVRDSKAFGAGPRARERRAAVARRIGEIAEVQLQVADADEVDRWCRDGGLNRLEQRMAERVIRATPAPRAVIADGYRLFSPLQRLWPELEAVDGADRHHPVVAAASIVAKVERDRRLACLLEPLEADFGPITGGGYPNQATARFLRAYVGRYQRLPADVRRSWSWPVVEELRRACEGDRVDRATERPRGGRQQPDLGGLPRPERLS